MCLGHLRLRRLPSGWIGKPVGAATPASSQEFFSRRNSLRMLKSLFIRKTSAICPLRQLWRLSPPAGWLRSCVARSRRSVPRRRRSRRVGHHRRRPPSEITGASRAMGAVHLKLLVSRLPGQGKETRSSSRAPPPRLHPAGRRGPEPMSGAMRCKVAGASGGLRHAGGVAGSIGQSRREEPRGVISEDVASEGDDRNRRSAHEGCPTSEQDFGSEVEIIQADSGQCRSALTS